MTLQTTEARHPLDMFLRVERLPHIWCPGCGLGTILSCFLKALKETDTNLDEIVVISGIGCAGRISGYVKTDSFHTTHGRSIPFATGVKIANPKLRPIIISGDGDLFAIGTSHFVHAARRNVDMLVICSNNFNYGMTGGQIGPTTPYSSYTSTSPYGHVEEPFNLAALAAASGAVYVARWSSLHPVQLVKSVETAMAKKGFRFIEVVNQCPTLYGRYNRMGSATEILKKMKEISVIRNGSPPAEATVDLGSKIVLGTFVDIDRPEFSEVLRMHGGSVAHD